MTCDFCIELYDTRLTPPNRVTRKKWKFPYFFVKTQKSTKKLEALKWTAPLFAWVTFGILLTIRFSVRGCCKLKRVVELKSLLLLIAFFKDKNILTSAFCGPIFVGLQNIYKNSHFSDLFNASLSVKFEWWSSNKGRNGFCQE